MVRVRPDRASDPEDATAARCVGAAGSVGRRGMVGARRMTYGTLVMALVAAAFTLLGIVLLARLRSPSLSQRKTYAYRMIGIMALSGGVVLGFSAAAMHQWSLAP